MTPHEKKCQHCFSSNNLEFEIYDAFGKLILSEKINTLNNPFSKELNLNFLSNGVYLLKASDGVKAKFEKLVKN